MLKTFPLDYIRQIISQVLYEEHINNPDLVGAYDQVQIFSFYEQLQTEEEVNRYVELYREITDQQNRTNLIMSGTVIAPENPTITNINQKTNIPMTFTCSLRLTLGDRDICLDSINNLIEKLKGRKVDIAEFDNGKLLVVGTIANNSVGTPYYKNGDFIGVKTNTSQSLTAFVDSVKTDLTNKEITYKDSSSQIQWFYYEESGKLKVAYSHNGGTSFAQKEFDNDLPFIVFPPEHNSFTKYQVSLSFDAMRVDEPRNLNAEQYCNISFGGSATISSNGIILGNELTKLCISKKCVKGKQTYNYPANAYWLEPMELPNSLNPNSQLKQLASNGFLTNDHIDSATPTLQYTFLMDKSIDLLLDIFKYSRYGTITQNGVTANTIYEVKEIFSTWGEVNIYTYLAKIVDSIDIENTESDTITITIPMKVQGAND